MRGHGRSTAPGTGSTRRPRDALRQFKFSPARTQRRPAGPDYRIAYGTRIALPIAIAAEFAVLAAFGDILEPSLAHPAADALSMTPDDIGRARGATRLVLVSLSPLRWCSALARRRRARRARRRPPLDTTIDTQLFQPAIGPRNFLTVEGPRSPSTSGSGSG